MSESIRINGDLKPIIQVKDPVEAMRLLAHIVMRSFTKEDWYGFSGCETKDPMIGETPDGDFTIVLDGSTINIIHNEDVYGGTMFELKGMD